MSSTKTNELIGIKASEIVDDISKATGVSSTDVEKVLSQLGLGNALANRLNVSARSVRIAAGQVQK